MKQALEFKNLSLQAGFESFHESVREWFARVGEPTECQLNAWSRISQSENVLITAPTGSGKTLAAFLSCINRLVEESLDFSGLADETRVLYISPLRALSNDIEKNLQAPLDGINNQLLGAGLPDHGITSAVRTGDTSAWERQKINRKPPHILVSTPESLYILLTSKAGRQVLSTVDTVIVDEIHALIDNKRGAHLALSLQRLAALLGRDFQRIGLSATIKDKEQVGKFLCNENDFQIIDTGSQRQRDLELCLPDSALTAVMSGEVWKQIYDQLVVFSQDHRTTLVFVNTRRLAERLARQLAERLDEQSVSTHHGSLSRAHRLDAENRLKTGQLKILVATASLELGIDIGDVDLVCQIGSPGSISTFLQRVGRSGHGVNRVPKGRLFPTTLEELVESVALIDAVQRGKLDTLLDIDKPLDVLAQQIVAEVSAKDWRIDELYSRFSQASMFNNLTRNEFDQVLVMLNQGFTNRRGRRFAYLHVDAVNGVVRARKSARLTALTNGGAIPELFDYDVFLVPDNFRVGSVNEDFAFESMAGDIFQLGNTSYRIVKVETGRVLVEDAHGQPPTIPFWFGEAPGRSFELSESVSELMAFCEQLFCNNEADPIARIEKQYSLDNHAAVQVYDYLFSAYSSLTVLPTFDTIVFERFFDENDDMHLVIHSLYGSRLNRAWGLALRKRFCRKFNFELQAAALESSIILSLGATHSFPLDEVKGYLNAKTVKEVVIQAMLDAPIFNTHWRWVCNISLAVKRYNGGKRLAPQIQRNNAEDLAAQVFPDQLACLENIAGEREIPDHPLVSQAIDDCIYEVMDVSGLEDVLGKIKNEKIKLVFKDVPQPSSLSQAIINARPYAFLDDIPAEERRTQALQSAVYGSNTDIQQYGLIPEFAIQQLREEIIPFTRSSEELHDALCVYGLLDINKFINASQLSAFLVQLTEQQRVFKLALNDSADHYYAAEWQQIVNLVYQTGVDSDQIQQTPAYVKRALDQEQATVELIRAQLEYLGPVTVKDLAANLELPERRITQALSVLEQEGFVMQGEYIEIGQTHWCERRLLARLHRYALHQARESIKAVTKEKYMRFLLDWQQLTPESKGRGINAVMATIEKLQGFAIGLNRWREILANRIEGFDISQLETLFLAGQLIWYRPRFNHNGEAKVSGLRKNSQIMIFKREAAKILLNYPNDKQPGLSSIATHVFEILQANGSLFFDEILEMSRLLPSQLEQALSELVDAGLIVCDSFQALLKLVNVKPQKRQLARRIGQQQPFTGRWSIVRSTEPVETRTPDQEDLRLQTVCELLLKRYGVIFYSLLQRESGLPGWRQLRYMLKRMEARGDVVGGRFVKGVGGEQFALNDAVTLLRKRKKSVLANANAINAVDPVNLSQILDLGERIPVKPKAKFVFNGERFSPSIGSSVDRYR